MNNSRKVVETLNEVSEEGEKTKTEGQSVPASTKLRLGTITLEQAETNRDTLKAKLEDTKTKIAALQNEQNILIDQVNYMSGISDLLLDQKKLQEELEKK